MHVKERCSIIANQILAAPETVFTNTFSLQNYFPAFLVYFFSHDRYFIPRESVTLFLLLPILLQSWANPTSGNLQGRLLETATEKEVTLYLEAALFLADTQAKEALTGLQKEPDTLSTPSPNPVIRIFCFIFFRLHDSWLS